MRLLAVCEGEKFHVSAGSGNKDLAWLAQVIAHIYGRGKHPTYNYTPIYLRNAAGDMPHPRSRINQVFTQNDEEVHVQIRKPGVELDEDQQEWYDKAFGKLRYRMKCKFFYAFEKRPFFDKYPDAKLVNFYVAIKFEKFPGSQIEFLPKDIQGGEEYPMEPRFDAKDFTDYYLEREFPFGKVTPELRVTYSLKGEDELIKKSLGSKEQGFTYEFMPNVMSDQEMLELEVNEIKKQPDLVEFKPDKEVEKEEPLGHCPFTIDTLWKDFDWTWLSKDIAQESMMKYLSNELDHIYEIFFHYSQFHVQDLSKRDLISITWQDLLLILKFYEIMPTGSILRNFLITYNQETNAITSVEDTISVENPVQFPEFVFILLRAISYVKHNYIEDIDFNEEKKSKDDEKPSSSSGSIFQAKLNHMIAIHANDEDLTDFQRHMLFSAPLIELLRLKSDILKQVFVDKLKNTLQPSEHKFYLLKGEICKIIDDIGFLGENVDQIVDTCFSEITPGEKYHEFEGLYYYEYLQALQWLSLVFIQKKEENVDPNEEDIEVNDETLIEKLGFFIERLEQTGEEEEEEGGEETYA